MKQGKPKDPNKPKGVQFARFEDPADGQEGGDNNQDENDQNGGFASYTGLESARETSLATFNECDSLFRLYTQNDPFCRKQDTVKGIIAINNKLKAILKMLTNAPQKDKEEVFNLVYNASLYTFEFCRVLRKSIYSIIAIDYLNH
jgi:hypothetical protein